MRSARTMLAIGVVALGALPLVGCGSERAVITAPSSAQAPTASSAGFIVTAERILPRNGVVTTTPITVTSLVSGTSCPTVRFMVGTYTFRVDAATQYEGGACANVQPGSRINFSGTQETGTPPLFYVARLTFVTSSTPPPTTPVSAEVTVSSLVSGTSCPSLSFMVGTYTISVSSATTFENGACVNIAAGVKLGLTGTRQGDGAITASKIEFRGNTTPPAQNVEGEGVITDLKTGTSCPALQFYIGTYLIQLDASTLFDRGACSDLSIGKRVHVKGTRTGDGAVLATQISVQSDSPGFPVVEGEGQVSSLVSGTACPSLRFMIEEWTVTLDASTVFMGGVCGDIAVGKKLGVKGTVTAEYQVLATQIVFKTDGGN